MKIKFPSKRNLIIVCSAVLVIVVLAAAIYFLTLPENASAPVSAKPVTESDGQEQTEFNYSVEDAQKIAEKAAKFMFGEDAFVICLGPEPAKVEIHGTDRYVYVFGADSFVAQQESGQIRGLYHIDADSGEVFDNGNGNMEKIMNGD
ncbi:MAG: hypothetical protein IKW02_01630 [Clostridia bacterium]|nr:hypothetical protein [Clostridia bacterium]